MRAPAALAVTRFAAFRWLADEEVKRASRKRWVIDPDDALQAALLGLHLADRRARVDMPESEFARLARPRIRGSILDEIRRIVHGSRYSTTAKNSRHPRNPEPGAIEVAQAQGTLPFTSGYDGELVGISPVLDPEAQLVARESEMALVRRIDGLPERERAIVRRRLAGDRGKDIATDHGISAARVSQLVAGALAMLHDK